MTTLATSSAKQLKANFERATSNASEAISKWTNDRVSLRIQGLIEAPIEEVSGMLEYSCEFLLGVTTFVEKDNGEPSGQLTWTLNEQDGRRLAAAILDRDSALVEEGELSALEKSALTETGNILSSAYLNELSACCEVNLRPSIPYLVRDFAASIIEQAIMPQAIEADRALISRVVFEFDGQELDWNLLFLPGLELQEKLKSAPEV